MNLKERLDTRLSETVVVESRPTHAIKLISEIGDLLGETVKIRGLADGVVGLFRTPDGQAYEVQLRPAQYARYGELLGTTPDPAKAHRREAARQAEWERRLRGYGE